MKPALINFLHIPKTAGTTFISILKRNFAADLTFQINGLDPEQSLAKIAAMPVERRDAFRLLMGHWSPQFEKFFSDREIQRIVFLREPVRHFLSTYYYIRKTKDHTQHEIANDLSLSDFLTYRRRINLDNLQTRHLAGIPTNMSAGAIRFEETDRKYVLKAKEELKRSRYVFLTDKFDDSLAILKHQGVLRNIRYKNQNVSVTNPEPLELTDELRAAIAQVNAFDGELYALAQELYGQQWRQHRESAMGDDKSTLSKLKKLFFLK